jgi:hypothetical protein
MIVLVQEILSPILEIRQQVLGELVLLYSLVVLGPEPALLYLLQ